MSKSQFVDLSQIRMHVVTQGNDAGKPVLLLHGFPDFWRGWIGQIEPLARKGFRVIVPDQRGYNLTSKPVDIDAYRTERLVGDIVELIEMMGISDVCVAGHDWGGVVAWHLAARYPQLVQRLAIVNAPHPLIMQRSLQGSFQQLMRSWYFYVFQLPSLPEKFLSFRSNVAMLHGMNWAGPAMLNEEDLVAYRTAWGQHGAIRSMVNWYRAAYRHPIIATDCIAQTKIETPTLVLWGNQDKALAPALAEASVSQCVNGKLAQLDGAGHWGMRQYPDLVTKQLAEHFQI